MATISLILSSVIQILFFSFIPFIWWFIKGKEKINFFDWIGLKKPIIKNRKEYVITFLITIIIFLALSLMVPLLVKDADLATSQFVGKGINALLPAFIFSFLQTGLSEEILFRGFLMKVLSKQFSFKIGNFIQATIFSLLHGIMFISEVSTLSALAVVLITGIIGALMGWINEKQSGGSIISSVMLHGIANLIASIVVMFSLI